MGKKKRRIIYQAKHRKTEWLEVEICLHLASVYAERAKKLLQGIYVAEEKESRKTNSST